MGGAARLRPVTGPAPLCGPGGSAKVMAVSEEEKEEKEKEEEKKGGGGGGREEVR